MPKKVLHHPKFGGDGDLIGKPAIWSIKLRGREDVVTFLVHVRDVKTQAYGRTDYLVETNTGDLVWTSHQTLARVGEK